MFCFNEFAFTVQVKHQINSIQILGFILICILRLATSVDVYFAKNIAYFPFYSWLTFQRLRRLLWGLYKVWCEKLLLKAKQLNHSVLQALCSDILNLISLLAVYWFVFMFLVGVVLQYSMLCCHTHTHSLDGFLKKASSNHQGAFWGKSGEPVFLT